MPRVCLFVAFLIVASSLSASAQPIAVDSSAGERSADAAAHAEDPEHRFGAYHLILLSDKPVRDVVKLLPSAREPQYGSARGRTYDLSRTPVCRDDNSSFNRAGSRPRLLVKTTEGRINVYQEATGHYHTGATYAQIGDGCVGMATTSRLRSVMVGHEEAMRRLNYDRAYGMLGLTAAMIGAGFVGTGVAVEMGAMEGSNGFLMAGSGVLLAVTVNAIVPGLQRSARTAAIRAYNR